MADTTGRPDPRDNPSAEHIVLDAQEMQDVIRGSAGDTTKPSELRRAEEAQPAPTEPEARQRYEEPEVIVEEETKPSESDLRKALSTIESLQREVADLRGRPAPRTVEPSIEMEEVIANVRLPKDRSKWPIQLTGADLEKVGIDGSIAPGMNVLANALFAFVAETIPVATEQRIRESLSQREAASKAQQDFEIAYPDLKDHQDLARVVEGKLYPENRHLPAGEYRKLLAREVRARIATMRGITYEDYVKTVSGAQQEPRRSRAMTTPSGRVQTTRPRSVSDLDDMLEK